MTAATLPQCSNGHDYTDDNTRMTTRGSRLCRTCLRNREDARLRPSRAQPQTPYTAPQNPSWRDHAACREIDPNVFQPRDETTARYAQGICLHQCAVVAQCGIEAKAQGPYIVGVWAGKWYREKARG